MNDVENKTGYFIFSLDTELAWGHYDCFPSPTYSIDSSRERGVVKRLLEIFDRFRIKATWALVGHMFYTECEKCSVCPIMNWKGKYSIFDQIYESSNPLWYGADIIDMLLDWRSVHEIAFHGYTHRIFDRNELSEAEARNEIKEWVRLSSRRNLIPTTVIFPRNKVGYLPMLKEEGFICYRGDQLMPRLFSAPFIGKVLKWLDFKLQFCIPEVYQATVEPGGIVNLPSSRQLFGMNPRISRILDRLNLNEIGIRRIIKGVEKAAEEKKVIHIRAHPYEFTTEKDFEHLILLLDSVLKEIKRGKIQSVTMGRLARFVLESNS